MYTILLYYCYSPIADPEKFREEHHLFCLYLQLKGRIVIAAEGINGTVSGSAQNCQTYMEHLHADPRFANVDFKVDTSLEHSFQKLHVRVKDEIVHSGLKSIDPTTLTGKHLQPDEFKKIKDDRDVVILDVRSDYEYKVGRFKNAITLGIENFREFPDKVNELAQYKNKKVITYCTGGIKCEKASAYLLQQGFQDVYQLQGGIIKYGLEAGGEDFDGKCYVFDNRVVVDINTVNPVVLSTCYLCGTNNDRMVNCANAACNLHVAICESCGWELHGACSKECEAHPQIRPYDGSGYYQKQMNGYDPYKGVRR